MRVSVWTICFIIWILSFVPGTVIEFKGMHEQNWKELVIGATLQCIASVCLLIMTFTK